MEKNAALWYDENITAEAVPQNFGNLHGIVQRNEGNHMSIYGDKAYETFFKGYNCAQCVAIAFAPVMHLTESQAARMSSGFGGGFGRLREVCGAFSGITFVLSTLYGSDDPAQKTATYTEVQALAAEYRRRNGKNTIVCRELLGLQKAEGSPVASPRTAEYYKKRPCPELCRLCADLCAEFIAAHPEGRHGFYKEDA